MWKLLSERDRKSVRSDEKDAAEAGLQRTVPHVITTPGIGTYVCSSCVNYGQAGAGPDPEKSCSQAGVPPDCMPCAFSPKKPERWFKPVPDAARPAQQSARSLDLPNALILLAILPNHIDQLIKVEELKLPYRQGDSVSFIYRQQLMSAEVLSFDESCVHVEVEGEPLALPHETVIPPKRAKTPTVGENSTETQS